MRADWLGKETTFGKIIEAVEKAEHSRAPIQKMADRLAGYLVYFALGAAVLTFFLTHNIRSTIIRKLWSSIQHQTASSQTSPIRLKCL